MSNSVLKVPALTLIIVCGIVSGFSAVDDCYFYGTCTPLLPDYLLFAVLCGFIAVFFASLQIILLSKAPEAANTVDPLVAIFFVIWQIIGAALVTSVTGPFHTIGNGYLSAWLAVIGALVYLSTVPSLMALFTREQSVAQSNSGLIGVFFASILETYVAIDVCDTLSCTDTAGWGVSVGIISIVLVPVYLVLERLNILGDNFEHAKKAVGPFFVIWWGFGVGFLTTSGGPFHDASLSSNGYFSTWVAFIASFVTLYQTNPAFQSLSNDLYAASTGQGASTSSGATTAVGGNQYQDLNDSKSDAKATKASAAAAATEEEEALPAYTEDVEVQVKDEAAADAETAVEVEGEDAV